MADSRIPVTLLTGFLGSGKTTLLARLVRTPGVGRIAAIINEFGDIGLDHDLLEASSEDIVMLEGGCLCCAMRGNLVDTFRDLEARRRQGAVAFDRAIVETSGLADPVPVLRLLMTDPGIAGAYRIDGVVTVADAVHGMAGLDVHPESVRQVSVADLIILAKSDVAGSAAEALVRRLHALNPSAEVVAAVKGEIEPARLFGLRAAFAADMPPGALDHRLDPRVRSFSLRYEAPLDGPTYRRLLDLIAGLAGPHLLRVKGIVHRQGEDRPLVLHAVQDTIHEPEPLAGPLHHDKASRVVFITWDIPPDKALAIEAATAKVT